MPELKEAERAPGLTLSVLAKRIVDELTLSPKSFFETNRDKKHAAISRVFSLAEGEGRAFSNAILLVRPVILKEQKIDASKMHFTFSNYLDILLGGSLLDQNLNVVEFSKHVKSSRGAGELNMARRVRRQFFEIYHRLDMEKIGEISALMLEKRGTHVLIKPEFSTAIWREYGKLQLHKLERFVSLHGEDGMISGARQPSREKLEDFLKPEARDSPFARKTPESLAQKPRQRWSKPGPKIQI